MNNKDLPYQQKPPFQVPDGYFESLEDRILQAAASAGPEVESLERIDSGFVVPDYYFERLETQVMEKLQKPARSKVRSLFHKETFYYAAGVAAVFVAILSTHFLKQPDHLSVQSLDMLSLEGYIDESIQFSTPDISQMFAEGDFSFTPFNQTSYVAQEAVIDYLHEHIEDPSLIFDED